MSWDVVVRATLGLGKAEVATWKKSRLDGSFSLPSSLPQRTSSGASSVSTVGAALKLLTKVASHSKIRQTPNEWRLWAVVSEDSYLSHVRDLYAACARVVTIAPASKGELVTYGWQTAPKGLGHRMQLGKKARVEKLDAAAERAVRASADAKAFDAWVESEIERSEENAENAGSLLASLRSISSVAEQVLSFVAQANDAALVNAVATLETSSFHPKVFGTGRKIKAACLPESTTFDAPDWAMRDLLRIVQRLDPEFAARSYAALLPSLAKGHVPDVLLSDLGIALCQTKHAQAFVRDVRFSDDGSNYGEFAGPDLIEWGETLASSAVPTPLLRRRFAEGEKGARAETEGAAKLAAYFAAALFTRRDWDSVPALARACFTHPMTGLRRTIAGLWLDLPVPVPVPAPPLADPCFLEADCFGKELCRRIRLDAKATFIEAQPLLEGPTPHYDSQATLMFSDLMTPKERAKVTSAEPRWRPFDR